MSVRNNSTGCATLTVVAIIAVLFSILCVVGLYGLVCLCFGIQFNFLHGVGIWAIISLLSAVFATRKS